MLREGSIVQWKKEGNILQGRVIHKFSCPVTLRRNGREITGEGRIGNVALIVEAEDGIEHLLMQRDIATSLPRRPVGDPATPMQPAVA